RADAALGLLLPDQRFDDELRLLLGRDAEREDHLGQARRRHPEVHHRVGCNHRRSARLRLRHGTLMDQPRQWSTSDSMRLYAVDSWADDFFFANDAGHAAVRPFPDSELAIDMVEVVTEARRRGMSGPLLLRFQDVLRARVQRLHQAFEVALA